MKMILVSALVLLTQNAWSAHVKLNGMIDHNGTKVKLDEIVMHGETLKVEKDDKIFNITTRKGKADNLHFVDVAVEKKDGNKISAEAKGMILVKDNLEATMTKMDETTLDTTIMKVMVEKID